MYCNSKFRHWLPIVTFCPVNSLPDLIYITVEVEDDKILDLYQVRKVVRKAVSFKKMYMEDVAKRILEEYPDAVVTVRLAFSRHVVQVYNEVEE